MKRQLLTFLSCLLFAGVAHADRAGDILALSGVKGGLIVHIGCGTAPSPQTSDWRPGTLAAALLANDAFLVHGLDSDKAKVAEARAYLKEQGLYGQATVDYCDMKRLPYIDNLVNLIVVEGSQSPALRDEIMRVLVPGGVALVDGKKIVKPRSADLDDWTHWLHGPDNNAVSRDKRVGVSRHLQWIMPPAWGRHHNLLPSLSTMVSAKGRIFCIIDEAPIAVRGATDKWALVCRDAFNGLVLWRRPFENWGWKEWSDIEVGGTMRFKGPDQIFRRLVAIGDTVYVTLGFNEPVTALDAATGKTIRTYKGTENTSAILYQKGRLFLTRNTPAPGKDMMAVEAKSGKILWVKEGYKGVTSRGDELKAYMDAYLTIGDEKVFFLNGDDVVALAADSGQEAWRSPRPVMKKDVFGHYDFNFINLCTLVYQDGIVFLGQIHPGDLNLNKWQQKDMELLAFDAKSGKKLWEHTGMTLAHFTPPDLFVNKGLVWTLKKEVVSLLGLDVRTGAVKKEYPVKDMLVGHHHRCYRNKATENFYLAGEEGIEYIDFDSGDLDVHHWLRGACAYGILPANGLIYLPTHACGCHANQKLNGFIALASNTSMEDVEPRTKEMNPLEKGPAFGKTLLHPSSINLHPSEDWPVFKHDNMRGNCAKTRLPADLDRLWVTQLKGRLTPPIVAAGGVYLASKDANEVYCLDSESGQIQWQFTTDGGVDTPPTYHKGALLLGTRAGSLYALRASDGQLIWRFRAAPNDRRLMAYDRLESPWPLNGSVLVMNDVIYGVAGRSMHLDSGMFVYALDPATGQVLQKSALAADLEPKGELAGTTLPDLLVGDGENIFMRSMRFDPDDLSMRDSKGGGSPRLKANDGGLLDGSWFNSAFWIYLSAKAQMLVFDERSAYGVEAYKKQIAKSYGQDVFTPGTNYSIFRFDHDAQKAGAKKAKKEKSPSLMKWKKKIPLRAEAIALTEQQLFLAGIPDVSSKDDPWGAFENREGGLLLVISLEDGAKIAEYKTDSAPVYDGLAAAQGRLFLIGKDGTVLCMGK